MWRNVRGMVLNNKPDNISITNEEIDDKAEDLNNFFANIGRETFVRCTRNFTSTNTNSDNVRVMQDFMYNLDFFFIFKPKPVNVETVILTISILKETKAIGSDGISLNFIKRAFLGQLST